MEQPEPLRTSALKGLLLRDQLIVMASLCAMCLLAWWWLLRSGQGLPAGAMPGMTMPVAGTQPAVLSAGEAIATFLMWLNMMVAMMLPSAAPMILTYERVAEGARKAGGALMPTGLFVMLYLAVWAGFSLLATLAQIVLAKAALLDSASLALGNRRLAGALLIAAALYQLTPAKRACLDNCRSPFSFLRREWGPGWSSAVRLGLKHGAYCVGCCWLIMALLFVGGVMNLAWVALLAVVVLAEKVAPAPQFTRYAAAGAALLGGLYFLIR